MPPAPGPTYPAAPWRLVGQMWLSVFRVPDPAADRPPGTHVAAFVAYEGGGTLTYSELLVAHRVGGTRARVTDIWVDSPASLAGGRELWAVPKQLGDFTRGTTARGRTSRTAWTACQEGRGIAQAYFTDVPRLGPRLPLRGATEQPPLVDAQPRTMPLRGSARVVPCRAVWQVDPSGPLGWLAGHRPLASCRLQDFRLLVG